MDCPTGSAPGRLDFLGGVADYSGALVLEMPTRQSIDVTAERSCRDLEPLRELGPCPVRTGLQESEEAKKAGGCPEHEKEPRTCRGPKLSSMGARVLFMVAQTGETP